MRYPRLSKGTIPMLGLLLLLPSLSLAAGDQRQAAVRHIESQGEPITATILLGKHVKVDNGQTVGEIKQLIVNRRGWITHAIVRLDGFKGVDGDNLVPVPWEVFEIKPDFVITPKDSPLTLKVSQEKLEGAPRLHSPHYPLPTNDVSKLDQANTYFKQEILEQRKEWSHGHGESTAG